MEYYIKSEIYKRALDRWGEDAQINMAIEECGELIVALIKRNRNRNKSSINQIIEEMVDVEIMIEQLKIIFSTKHSEFESFTFEIYKRRKLNRLNERLNE